MKKEIEGLIYDINLAKEQKLSIGGFIAKLEVFLGNIEDHFLIDALEDLHADLEIQYALVLHQTETRLSIDFEKEQKRTLRLLNSMQTVLQKQREKSGNK